RRQSGTQLIDFGLGQALCCHCAGDQAHGQAAGTNDYVLIHYIFSKTCCLEAYAEADSGKVAVNQGVVLAIKEVGVADAGVVLVGVVGIQTDADRLGVLDEVRAVALNVVRPGDIRAQVDTGNHVAVVQGGTEAVAPGEVGVVTVVLTPAAGARRFTRRTHVGGTYTIGITALAKQGVTAEFGFAVATANTTDVVSTYFTNQCQTARTEDTGDEMDSTHGGLPELLALVPAQVVAGRKLTRGVAMGVVSRTRTQEQCSEAHVAGIDLHGHVGAVADLPRHGHTGDIGTEADAIQADIFRMLEEVTGAAERPAIISGRQVSGDKQRTHFVGVDRAAAVIVHRVEAELGIIQSRGEPAESYTELATV